MPESLRQSADFGQSKLTDFTENRALYDASLLQSLQQLLNLYASPSNEARVSVQVCCVWNDFKLCDPPLFCVGCPVFLCNDLQSLQVYNAKCFKI